MDRFRALAVFTFTLAAFFGLAAPAAAQDDGGTMTFGEDEAKEAQEEGTMVFGEEEAEETASDGQSANPLVGLVAVPGDAIDGSERRQLKDELVSAMQKVPDVQLETGTAVLDVLRNRTIASCVKEPLCLGGVGEDAGVDRILMARVRQQNGAYVLDIDYFNVADRLFIKYKSVEGLSRFRDVTQAVLPAVKEVFDLRDDSQEEEFVEDNTAQAMTIVGISSAALAAGSLVSGIAFGLKAQNIQTELDNAQTNSNGVYTNMTQAQARTRLDTGKNVASAATISYVLAGVFTGVSVTSFIVSSNKKKATEGDERGRAKLRDLKVAPVFGKDSAGLSAGFRF